MKSVLIVGAGYGGLATAALLAKDGFNVTILEKNSQVGGRAQLWQKDGFTFNMGPSWYLMPDVFEKYFSLFNESVSDYLDLKRLDPAYDVIFSQDQKYSVSGKIENNIELFESLEENGGKKFVEYLKKCEYQYNTAMDRFIYKPNTSLLEYLDIELITKGLQMGLLTNMDSYSSKHFDSDIARKILQYSMVFLGGDPRNTPALYSLMAHVDFNLGVFYPTGGMNAVADALLKLGEKQGVDYELECNVESFSYNGESIKKVHTSKGDFEADLIIMNGDYAHAELNLLDEAHRTYDNKYWQTRDLAPSAYLIYLGLDKKIDSLNHHNLILQHEWNEHFDQVFETPDWPDNPSYYVSVASKDDPQLAPPGSETLFFLVPVASGLSDSDEVREEYFEKTINNFEEISGENVRDHIVVKRIYTHRDFSADYNAYKGTALGLAHTLKQTAIFRPSIKSKKVDNLYYVGQYTHPGIGVPMVLIASQIVRDEISKR